MNLATVCFLLREEDGKPQILLGKRNSLFCPGIWNGPGGKKKNNETIERCVIREIREEIGVTLNRSQLQKIAVGNFFNPYDNSDRRQEWLVHFLVTRSWKGDPEPREGFSELRWFPLENLPLKDMMPDQAFWLPQAIRFRGEKLTRVEIHYADKDMKEVSRGSFHLEKTQNP